MSERRRALIARFRAVAADRIRRVTVALAATGEDDGDGLKLALRELHTLKGESRMLDFVLLADTMHAVEDKLAAASPGKKDGLGAVLGVLDVASRYVKGELGDEDAATTTLALARASLEGDPSGHPPPGVTIAPVRSARPESTARPDARVSRWVSVNAAEVDRLCERLSEFEAGFRRLNWDLRARARTVGRDSDEGRRVHGWAGELEECETQLDQLSQVAWALRLVPVQPLLEELLTHARSIAAAQQKKLRITAVGGHVHVERTILDGLADPLLHLARNAVDHGVEPPSERGDKGPEATLLLRAEASGPNVVLTIEDDGRGIDPDKVRAAAVSRGLATAAEATRLDEEELTGLLFRHGFSTRTDVSELSGRGVGLDVVRAAVEAIGGTVALASKKGIGTSFTLTVPATISKERALVLESAGCLYAVPSRQVGGVVRAQSGALAVEHDGRSVPVQSLAAALGHDGVEPEVFAVLVPGPAHVHAFAVARVLGEFALLRRPVDPLVFSESLVAASATFEDGRLVLMLSPPALVRHRAVASGFAGDVAPLSSAFVSPP